MKQGQESWGCSGAKLGEMAGEDGGERGREKQSANLQVLHHGHQQGRWTCSNQTQGDGNYHHRSHRSSPSPTTEPSLPVGPGEQHLGGPCLPETWVQGEKQSLVLSGAWNSSLPSGTTRYYMEVMSSLGSDLKAGKDKLLLRLAVLPGEHSGRQEQEESQGLDPAVPLCSKASLRPIVLPHKAQFYRIF